MENNSVYDILTGLSSPAAIQNDLREIQGLVSGYFKNKYFDRLESVVKNEISRQKTNPADDLKLLYALKPYAGGAAFDNVIEACAAFKAIDNLRAKIPLRENTQVKAAAVKQSLPDSVNPDGVYDIDPLCIAATSSKTASEASSLSFIVFILIILCMSQ